MPSADAAPHLGDGGVDPGGSARHTACSRRHQRLTPRIPGSAWPEEERDLDTRVRAEPRQLANLRRP